MTIGEKNIKTNLKVKSFSEKKHIVKELQQNHQKNINNMKKHKENKGMHIIRECGGHEMKCMHRKMKTFTQVLKCMSHLG